MGKSLDFIIYRFIRHHRLLFFGNEDVNVLTNDVLVNCVGHESYTKD